MVRNSPIELLAFVKGQLEAYHKARGLYAKRLAPAFSPLEFLDTRENGLSRIIAWLLDPRGNHEQGAIFLRHFISWLGLGEEWSSKADAASVVLEWPIWVEGQQGYIDVLVNLEGRALVIENKPWAIDQPRQVARYLTGMERDFPAASALVYLSGYGVGPSEFSIAEVEAQKHTASGRLKVAGYLDLLPWVAACLASCRAPLVAVMLEGLGRYIQKEFGGVSDTEQSTDLAASIVQSQASLEAALALFEAEAALRRQVISKFIDQVKKEADARGWHIIRSDMSDGADTGIVVGFNAGAAMGFGLQFDARGYRNLFYGFASDEQQEPPKAVVEAIQGLTGSKDQTEWWPCWKWVNPNDRFFPLASHVDSKFWLMANDGRLCEMFFAYLDEVAKLLDELAEAI